jgi:hypothetical protein
VSADSHPGAATLTRLRRELAEDRQAMALHFSEIAEATPHVGERPWSSHAALAVHGWYTAFEAAVERAVRVLDGEVPAGERWHRDLLSQATVEVPGVRPAIVSRDALPELLSLLAFRHFLRHAYAVPMDPERLLPEMKRVRRLNERVMEGLSVLDVHLEATIEALLRDG